MWFILNGYFKTNKWATKEINLKHVSTKQISNNIQKLTICAWKHDYNSFLKFGKQLIKQRAFTYHKLCMFYPPLFLPQSVSRHLWRSSFHLETYLSAPCKIPSLPPASDVANAFDGLNLNGTVAIIADTDKRYFWKSKSIIFLFVTNRNFVN